jgi:hypothetical protein
VRVRLSEEDLQTLHQLSVPREPTLCSQPEPSYRGWYAIKRPSPTKGIEPPVIVQHLIPAAEARGAIMNTSKVGDEAYRETAARLQEFSSRRHSKDHACARRGEHSSHTRDL